MALCASSTFQVVVLHVSTPCAARETEAILRRLSPSDLERFWGGYYGKTLKAGLVGWGMLWSKDRAEGFGEQR